MNTTAFPINSRYHLAETATYTTADGRELTYLRRRFVPAAESLAPLAEHSVAEGDRLDNLAAAYFGDPELFWRICDANVALWPPDLVATPGERLRITLPQGIPGLSSV